MTVLQEYDAFNTTIVRKQEIENEKICTTSISQDLINGELQKANDALGYIYSIKGTVVQGEKRGTIGFPTANIQPSDDYLLPRKGVYAVSIEIGTENI